MKEALVRIREKLIPYYREWDKLGDYDEESASLPEPDPPEPEIMAELLRYVEKHPECEVGLEELAKVQLLTGDKVKGIATLKQLIGLPVKRHPKKMHQLKSQLRNLESETD